MSAEELLLPVRTAGSFEMVPVEVSNDGGYTVTVSRPGRSPVTGEGHDLVAALRAVRLELEHDGALLWVNGARRNVHASGMQRDMAAGRHAYVLPEQRTQERPPSVDLMEGPSPESDVVTVAEQDAWYDAWLTSPPPGQAEPAATGQPRRPSPALVAAARSQPGGWVYEIVGDYGRDDAVPPEAVRGGWPVDQQGEITGDFVANPNFRPVDEREKPDTDDSPRSEGAV